MLDACIEDILFFYVININMKIVLTKKSRGKKLVLYGLHIKNSNLKKKTQPVVLQYIVKRFLK